jgi:hypothetical protein
VGLGGLQCRKAAELGTIYDHHAITYEYPNGVKSFFTCRQQQGTAADVSSRVIGTMGTCQIDTGKIATRSGETKWRYRGPKNVMTQTEHDELFAALRAGQVINNGDYMCKSTLLTIMGRMASYTGQKVTWEIALNSQENLSPPAYEWGPAPKGSIAIPGVTPLV